MIRRFITSQRLCQRSRFPDRPPTPVPVQCHRLQFENQVRKKLVSSPGRLCKASPRKRSSVPTFWNFSNKPSSQSRARQLFMEVAYRPTLSFLSIPKVLGLQRLLIVETMSMPVFLSMLSFISICNLLLLGTNFFKCFYNQISFVT